MGLALIPQAGVAIGLATMGARTIGGATGEALQTIILASSVLYELVGPGCAKLSLYLSKSYSTKIEDKVITYATHEDGTIKTEAELLIERIQAIKNEVKINIDQKEEDAFTEAAMEDNEIPYIPPNQRGIHRRNRR